MKTENNLEKKAGVAGTLKDFIISELAPYIPFSLMSKTIMGSWIGKGKDFKKGFSRKIFSNVLISALTGAAIYYYSIASLSMGTPNYTKWSKIENQRVIQKEQEARDYSNEQFYKADKNGDLIIDSNEFYDYIQGGRK